MSATNPVESNLEVLLTQIKEERDRSAPSSRRREYAGDEILVTQILAATADIERQATAEGLDPVATLGLVAARTLTLTQASGVAIGLVAGNEIVCRANAGNAPDVGARIELRKGLSGECIRTGKTVRSDDTSEDARVDPAAGAALNLRSAVAVPICCAGKVIGVLEVFSAEPNAFDDWVVLAISQIAHFIGRIANASAEPTLEAPTSVDPLPLPVEHSRPGGLLRGVVRAIRQIAIHHGRMMLLLLAALVTVAATAYHVRDMMMKSARVHRRAELAVPSSPTPAGQAAVPVSTVPQDPAIAREDGRIPDAPIPRVVEKPQGRHELRESTPSPVTEAASTLPQALASEPVIAELHPPEATPRPPALVAVQPPPTQDAALAPLMQPPVRDPQLAAAPTSDAKPPTRASIFTLMSRKLKGLVQKDPKKASAQPSAQGDSQPSPTTQ